MGQKWLDYYSNLKTKIMNAVRNNYLGIDVSKQWFDLSLLVVLNRVSFIYWGVILNCAKYI